MTRKELEELERQYLARSRELGKRPNSNEARSVYVAFRRSDFSKFEINSWQDFTEYCGLPIQGTTTKTDFEEFLKQVKLFHKENKRSPHRNEFIYISSLLTRKVLQKYGVKSWNDILWMCDLPVNLARDQSSKDRIFKRDLGRIKEYYEKHNHAPSSDKFPQMVNLIATGMVNGITRWTEFLISIGIKPLHLPNQWTGEKGLLKARDLIVRYYNGSTTERNKLEETRLAVRRAVNFGRYKEFGINYYHDLLKFSGVDAEKFPAGYWDSYKSYQDTLDTIKELYTKNNKTPTVEEVMKISRCFHTAISKGQWKKFGVNGYNDLLEALNIPVNEERYDELETREGLDHYISLLKKKHSELGRVPECKEFEDPKLAYLIHSKKWSEFGVDTYFDFVTAAGLEFYNINWGDLEDHGIEIAVGMAMKVHKETGHIPLSSEIDKVLYPIHKGLFKKFGIDNFYDFLKYCGYDPRQSRNKTKGLPHKGKNYWRGKKGYERAYSELRSHIQKHKRLPTKATHGSIYSLFTSKKWVDLEKTKWKSTLSDIVLELKKEGFVFEGRILNEIKYRLEIEI